jgi:type IV secretory pathway VirB10-like protein
MARKLKTYVTRLGFFDLAVAAPSMKAAMEAWGIKHNAFHRGDAFESDDKDIVAATMAHPGTVLRRPVGTDEPFQEDAALPAGFSLPVNAPAPKPKEKSARRAAKTKKLPRAANSNEEKNRHTAIISFEKARAERERARAKEDAAARREAEKRASALEKAQSALDEARKKHQERRDKLTSELDRRLEEEEARWNKERKKLEAALDQARRS